MLDFLVFIITRLQNFIIIIIIKSDNLTIINFKVFETLLKKLLQKKVEQILVLSSVVVIILTTIALQTLFNNLQFNILFYFQ